MIVSLSRAAFEQEQHQSSIGVGGSGCGLGNSLSEIRLRKNIRVAMSSLIAIMTTPAKLGALHVDIHIVVILLRAFSVVPAPASDGGKP
jgi:hypothetical protein